MLRHCFFQLPKRQVLWQCSHGKFFHNTAFSNAINNFCMPALSPTMEEGSIAKWILKEGDTFKAGDAILEVETDKATMDVEAQDDGILAKILINPGTKIAVGKEIGILAEEGDDLSKIKLPEVSSTPEKVTNLKPSLEPSSSSSSSSSQNTPLLPSVAHLLHLHKIQDPSVIAATGPRGRLLKGDVLAFVGEIKKDAPKSTQKAIQKLEKLDLSKMEAKPMVTEQKPEAVPEKPRFDIVETSLSLASLINITKVTKENTEELPEKIRNIVSSAISESLASSEIPDLFQDPVENAYETLLGLPSSKTSDLPNAQCITGEGSIDNVADFLCKSSIILPAQLSDSLTLSFVRPNPLLEGKTTLDGVYDYLLGPVQEQNIYNPSHSKNEEVVLKISSNARVDSQRAVSFMNKVKRNLEAASLN
ncbi:pyruvate dehydrogenase protein x component, Pdx1 [Schizosaccharomyces osmophilus]|uniref:Pyruvate dehydrogenase protein x component, Pdx1 n=1 Tax=Schizosaccharomyces osmophilus TaxID=2545709 RepID=A0AAE9WB93_9SCHI|nr:pyruvate dehydrogenase protein x component, Pdx1 [Schizosaccharomyces osmophilus]WBW73091.1 pyruvate dehydrogenase protein x component, Pdx1 [Schizosaccharomyces osmophilus]